MELDQADKPVVDGLASDADSDSDGGKEDGGVVENGQKGKKKKKKKTEQTSIQPEPEPERPCGGWGGDFLHGPECCVRCDKKDSKRINWEAYWVWLIAA